MKIKRYRTVTENIMTEEERLNDLAEHEKAQIKTGVAYIYFLNAYLGSSPAYVKCLPQDSDAQNIKDTDIWIRPLDVKLGTSWQIRKEVYKVLEHLRDI